MQSFRVWAYLPHSRAIKTERREALPVFVFWRKPDRRDDKEIGGDLIYVLVDSWNCYIFCVGFQDNVVR